jgi:diguanylate cyclase (GGDEF)-like protein
VLLRRKPGLPVVIVTGEGSLEIAMQAIRHGAYDYVVKVGHYLDTIPLIVQKNLAIWRTKRENERLRERLENTLAEVRVKNEQLQQAVQRLEAIATTDPLTGLANRRALEQALERCFAEAARYGGDLACLMIDLDNFKHLNDAFGHQTGDEVLRRTARLLEACCRRSDVAARYGGDEFVVLLPKTDQDTARQVAQRIAREYDAAVRTLLGGRAPAARRIGVSMGLACLRHARAATADQLVCQADQALYRAKETGKMRICVYGDQQPDRAAVKELV